MERHYLNTESQLKTLLMSAKEANVIFEMILDGENTLDVFVDEVPKYSFIQGAAVKD